MKLYGWMQNGQTLFGGEFLDNEILSQQLSATNLQTARMKEIFNSYIDGLKNCLKEIEQQDIVGIAYLIYQAYKMGNQIFIFGNGGSAATASHMACDLKKGAIIPGKPRLKVTSLTDNVSLITALSNDNGYESVFFEQLYSQVEEGDVVVAISCSGNSPNVIKAVEYAKNCGATVVAFTAFGGGQLLLKSDRCINLSTTDYGQGEDIAVSIEHILAAMIKELIYIGE